MRLLYASHTYLINENQKKLTALAALPDVESLACVVPHVWRESILGNNYPHIDPAANFTLYPTRITFLGNEMRFFYWSRDLHIPSVQPDVIVVENGAGAFAYTQFARYRQRYAPQAKLVFFTWWNLPYRPRQPFRALEQYNLRQTSGAIAGNRDAEAILRQQGYSGPILVLPQLGVDAEVFSPGDQQLRRAALGLKHFTIGSIGRLVPEKGLQVMMAALDGFEGAYDWLVVGRGPLEAELRAWGQQRPPHQRLHLIPSVPHSEVADYMRVMDVFVLPSLTTDFWMEQFGHALIEAMACEVATVGSSSAEIPHVIGDAGLVIPEGDPLAWREALQQLASDVSLRAKLAQKGRQRVLDYYTHERIARQTVDFFAKLMNEERTYEQ